MKSDASDVLEVNMFGDFCMRNENYDFISSQSKGLSSSMLLAYLLSNKETQITTDRLIEVLWPEDSSDNPGGALRTLAYRTRKFLQNFYPNEDISAIAHNNNSYFWNPEVPVSIDIYEFEANYKKGMKEEDEEQKYKYYMEAYKLYKGEFLPLFSNENWVMFRSHYYSSQYLLCVQEICSYLSERKQYDEIIQICNTAIELAPPTQETIHKVKLRTYLDMGSIQSALDYYYSLTDLFNQKFGLDITASMADIYDEIIAKLPNQYLTMESLENNLKHDKDSAGSFYCNFDIFKNIYQINMRSVRRSRSKYFLLLLTLKDENFDSILSKELQEEMTLLQALICSKLRRNDVFTKSSVCQFSLIITVPNEHSRDIVIDRLIAAYENKRKHSHISISLDVNRIA